MCEATPLLRKTKIKIIRKEWFLLRLNIVKGPILYLKLFKHIFDKNNLDFLLMKKNNQRKKGSPFPNPNKSTIK